MVAPGKRSTPVLISVLIGVLVALLLGAWGGERPNLVVIVVDTLRADSVSIEPGNAETPNIATLAAEGTVFPLCYSHAPMTLPAHASLFSGRHPWETGVLNNGQEIPADLPLLAEHLAGHDYQTAAAVSLATMWPSGVGRGLDRGFDEYETGFNELATGEETGGRLRSVLDRLDPSEPFFLLAHFSDPHEPYNDQGASGRVAEIRLDEELVEVVSTSQMSFWEADFELARGKHRLALSAASSFRIRSLEVTQEGQPFPFHFVAGEPMESTQAAEIDLTNGTDGPRTVHVRAWINDEPSTTEIHARYASEVQAADAAIGHLAAELMRRGLWENTVVVLTSDHGEALGEHGLIGHVENLYDELLHVPLVIRLPHGRPNGQLRRATESLVRHVDVAPTVLDLLGLPGLSEPSGRSLLEEGEETLIAETHPPEAPRTLYCLRDQTYKLIYAPEEEAFEMYRLGPDPLEMDNVFAHQGHLRDTWQLVLKRLAEQVGTPDTVADASTAKELSALGY